MSKKIIKDIKTVWKSKSQIIEGIKNSIFTNETIEEMSKERLEICNGCENIDLVGDSCVVKSSAPCCKLCGCCLKLSTRSLSYICKDGKWPTLFSEEENIEISLILNYKEKLNSLLKDNVITQEEYQNYLNDLTSENKHISLNVRYKIRFLL